MQIPGRPRRVFPDRRPVRAIPLYNGNPDHPWGLSDPWVEGGVPWLLETMIAAYRNGSGFKRFMWTLPAGRESIPFTAWPSAQWQLLDDADVGVFSRSGSVRKDLARLIEPWLEDHSQVQLIVYLGGIVKSPFNRTVDGARVPNPFSDIDLLIMHLNFDGFAALAPMGRPFQLGFWFDNSSPPEKRDKEYRVVKWLHSRSLWGGMEAVANDGTGVANHPNADFVAKVPLFGIRSFWEPVTTVLPGETPPPGLVQLTQARAQWSFDPNTSEVGFFAHAFRPEDPHGLSDQLGIEKLQNYHDRGCILGTYVERWEDAILSIAG